MALLYIYRQASADQLSIKEFSYEQESTIRNLINKCQAAFQAAWHSKESRTRILENVLRRELHLARLQQQPYAAARVGTEVAAGSVGLQR